VGLCPDISNGGIILADSNNDGCGYKNGSLPGTCAPLAMAYVPMQQSAKPAYDPDEALERGTLFPGLDLPFMNMVNSGGMKPSPLCELMSLTFVADELELYLDTHPGDSGAFSTYQDILKLLAEARRRYVSLYGPVSQSDMLGMSRYSWIDDPWPWDYTAEAED
jgi:spore coat protein JB